MELNQEVGQIAFLSSRFVQKKGQKLTLGQKEGEALATPSPLRLHIPASIILLVILALFVWVIWPMMGMPVLIL